MEEEEVVEEVKKHERMGDSTMPDRIFDKNPRQVAKVDNPGMILGDEYHPTRDELPHLNEPGMKYSVWDIIKGCIGKDLTKITLPVILNEPISML